MDDVLTRYRLEAIQDRIVRIVRRRSADSHDAADIEVALAALGIRADTHDSPYYALVDLYRDLCAAPDTLFYLSREHMQLLMQALDQWGPAI